MLSDAREKLVGDIIGIEREGLGKFEGGVRIQSILAAVQVRNADGHQLFKFPAQVARGHDGLEMFGHGGHDFRPVGGRPEHVGNLASFFDKSLKCLAGPGVSLIERNFGESWHVICPVAYAVGTGSGPHTSPTARRVMRHPKPLLKRAY